jgi:flagellin
MKQLAEQAATGSYSSAQRDIMNSEFEEMANEIDRIAQATVFNSITLLDSASSTVTIHLGQRIVSGTATDDTIDVTAQNMRIASGLAIDSNSIDITNTDSAMTALTAVTSAITAKDEARAAFGYMMNRMESTAKVLGIQAENLMTAESRISDVDVATEPGVGTSRYCYVGPGQYNASNGINSAQITSSSIRMLNDNNLGEMTAA